MAAARRMLARVPRSSSRCLTLIDRTDAVTIEMTATDERVLRDATLLHTNHYLHDDLRAADASSDRYSTDSRRRHARLSQACEPAPVDAAAVGRMLDGRAFQKAGHADPRRVETVATVVMDPAACTPGPIEWPVLNVQGDDRLVFDAL